MTWRRRTCSFEIDWQNLLLEEKQQNVKPIYKVLLERSGEVLTERSDKVALPADRKPTLQLIKALGVICSIAWGVSEAMGCKIALEILTESERNNSDQCFCLYNI